MRKLTIIETLEAAIEQSKEGLKLSQLEPLFPQYTRIQIRNALAIATRTKRLKLLKRPKGLGCGMGTTQGVYGIGERQDKAEPKAYRMVTSVFDLAASRVTA